MLKSLFLCCLLTCSTLVMASPLDQLMTVKERLRLSLLIEGIESGPKEGPSHPQKTLPEEIERPLRKL